VDEDFDQTEVFGIAFKDVLKRFGEWGEYYVLGVKTIPNPCPDRIDRAVFEGIITRKD
jgi:hypothetical protein